MSKKQVLLDAIEAQEEVVDRYLDAIKDANERLDASKKAYNNQYAKLKQLVKQLKELEESIDE